MGVVECVCIMVLFLRALQVSSGLQGFGHVSEMFATKIYPNVATSLYVEASSGVHIWRQRVPCRVVCRIFQWCLSRARSYRLSMGKHSPKQVCIHLAMLRNYVNMC